MFKVSDDDILMSTNNYSSFYRAEINRKSEENTRIRLEFLKVLGS